MVWLTLKDRGPANLVNRIRIGPFGSLDCSHGGIWSEGSDLICKFNTDKGKWMLMVVARSWETTFTFDEAIID